MLAQGLLWTVNPLLLGGVARYRAIAAGTLAAAMLGAARSGRRGVNRYTYREMSSLAEASAPEHARL
jgi:hypothetical protein